ncbi:MAG: anti-sigma F factor [Ruminococcaceae bacterium]|nr:anti-sigma F factor [Oscillospiraceae bacterium]
MKNRRSGEKNRMHLCLPALSVNEGVARSAVAVFCAQMDIGVTQLADIKCAVSEAVTNCIVHAYKHSAGMIYITVTLYEGGIRVIVKDKGCGIADVKKAREPLYTTDAENERSGMGFTVMENFMDRLAVRSRPGKGTVVIMSKRISAFPEKE